MLLNKLLKILFVISLILLIITLSFKVFLFNFNSYKKEFIKYNIYEKIPDADKNALNLINYMNNKEELNDFFNDKEKLHLKDVKGLFKKLNFIFYITLSSTILFLIYFIYIKNYKSIYSIFFITGIILMGLLLLFFFIIDFNYLFTKFHLLFFNNDLWQLNPNQDNLINLFPEIIQYNITMKIFISILISAVVLIILTLIIKRLSKSFLNKGISGFKQ